MKRTAKPESVDDYLATLSVEKKAALQNLRNAIRSAAPRAEECISYGIPAFRLDGRVLVHFHAATNHCSFFPGAHPLVACKTDVAKYDTSKGTVRFPPDKPLPVSLVRKLVKARIAQHAALAKVSAQKRNQTEKS